MSDTTRLGLPLIEAGQAQKHVTHNEALRVLDALVQAVALDRDLGVPPASPADGATWIVGPSPSAGWAGHAGELAVRADGAWTFLAPTVGWTVWLVDEACPVVWDGGAWRPLVEAIGQLTGLLGLGVGTAPDATNRLAVRSPAALFTGEPASGGGTGDMRLTVAKEASGDTASLLLQTGWSGRAELGLLANDDLAVKVSTDGAAWTEALRIAAATGQILPGAAGIAGGGRLRSMVGVTATGTWTRPAGVRFVLVFAVGGGGGGGGAAGATASGAVGGGGGAGGLAVAFVDVAAIAFVAVTVGAAGTAGTTSGGTGGTGGTTSFGSEAVATGGAGGVGMAAGTTALATSGGAGGATSAGDFGFTGAAGAGGLRIDGAIAVPGNGAPSFFGGGGRAVVGNTTGAAGPTRGSGGAGGSVSNSTVGRAGGAGGAGFVWVWEFE